MSDKKDKSPSEQRLLPVCAKSAIIAEFLKEYREHAGWDEWLVFLDERPELQGFEWARSLACRHFS